jgi:hypothetical protein
VERNLDRTPAYVYHTIRGERYAIQELDCRRRACSSYWRFKVGMWGESPLHTSLGIHRVIGGMLTPGLAPAPSGGNLGGLRPPSSPQWGDHHPWGLSCPCGQRRQKALCANELSRQNTQFFFGKVTWSLRTRCVIGKLVGSDQVVIGNLAASGQVIAPVGR